PRPKPAPKPAPVVKPAEPVKPVEPVMPAEPVKPAEVPKPAEPVKPVEPVKPAEPVRPTQPAKPARPARPVPKPKKEKPPKEPIDHIALWPPWALGAAGVLLSAFRDFGFEGVPALLWGLMGWGAGMMVRLLRLYRSPITMQGTIVLEDEANPKGQV